MVILAATSDATAARITREQKLGDSVSPGLELVWEISGGEDDGVIDDPENIRVTSPEIVSQLSSECSDGFISSPISKSGFLGNFFLKKKVEHAFPIRRINVGGGFS